MLIAAALAATVTLTGRDRVTLTSALVRIGDVAQGGSPVSDVIIAHLSAGRRTVAVSRTALTGLIRRAVPGIRVVDPGGAGTITFRLPAVQGPKLACAIARSPIAAGATVTVQTVARRPCAERVESDAVGYDRRTGEVTARRPIAAGKNLGAIRLFTPPAVRTGDALTLISRAGPVTIERPVEALQPGREGRRVFVRDRAGNVSSIPLTAGAER